MEKKYDPEIVHLNTGTYCFVVLQHKSGEIPLHEYIIYVEVKDRNNILYIIKCEKNKRSQLWKQLSKNIVRHYDYSDLSKNKDKLGKVIILHNQSKIIEFQSYVVFPQFRGHTEKFDIISSLGITFYYWNIFRVPSRNSCFKQI